jgi:hypothetical protein
MKITHTCKLKLNCITIIFPFSWTEFWSLASNGERKGATQNNTYSKRVGKSIGKQILSFIRKCFMGCFAYIVGFTVHLLRAGRQTLSLDKALRVSQYMSQKLFILIVFTIVDFFKIYWSAIRIQCYPIN